MQQWLITISCFPHSIIVQVERAEDNLCSNTTSMSVISKTADDKEKVRKELERALMAREDQIEQLENKHKV